MLSKKIKHLKYQNRNFSINSKKVNKNDIFFAIEGSKQSGSLYSSEALSKGAYKVITSKNIRNKNYLIVKNVKKFLVEACSVKYKEKPKNIIAVTGTNGKSSVANFYFQILKNLKINSAAIGTLGIFYKNKLIASGGYLISFPIASALVAEGLDRSRSAGIADFKAQITCWILAMIPVYIIGTLWLAESYGVDMAQAFEWGVEPFLIWDFAKIVVMALVTTKLWSYSQPE